MRLRKLLTLGGPEIRLDLLKNVVKEVLKNGKQRLCLEVLVALDLVETLVCSLKLEPELSDAGGRENMEVSGGFVLVYTARKANL